MGKAVTTSSIRSECAKATRSGAAPKRSPSTTMSEAPPGTLPK